MPQSFVCFYVHLIFSTKNREPLIEESWAQRLYDYVGGIAQKQGSVLVGAGGMPDHIHLLVSLSKQLSIADQVRDLKANSSGWVHANLPEFRHFAWQSGYAAFSVSQSSVGRVLRYIKNQKQHHRKRSFQEEYLAFLKKHHVEYDERYVFD